MKDVQFQKRLFFYNSLIPFLMLIWDWSQNRLGVNPVEAVLRTTGVLTLLFLVFTLLVTPLAKNFGWVWIIKQRRLLGLYSFFYGCTHLIVYLFLDRGGDFSSVSEDISKRPFIAIGMLSFFLMIPLAVTSTNEMIRRLGGKRWKRLHQLTYIVSIGGVVHFWMIVKSDITYPLSFALVIAALLLYRLKTKMSGM